MIRFCLRTISAACLLTIIISFFQISPPKISPLNLVASAVSQLQIASLFSETQKETIEKGILDARRLYNHERDGYIRMIAISYVGLFVVCIATFALSFLPATKIQAQQDAAANP